MLSCGWCVSRRATNDCAAPLGRIQAAALASKGCRIAPTWTCVHTPPRAVRTLRSLSFAAMALWLVAPARTISLIIALSRERLGRTKVEARGRLPMGNV